MKKKFNWNVFLIELLVIVLFIMVLIQIPSFFSDKTTYNDDRNIVIGDSSRIIEETKFEIIAVDILESMKNRKITENLDEFSINLTLGGHFQNRENTIAQELIGLHLKGNLELSQSIAKHIIEDIFSKYDNPQEYRLRNYILTLIDKDNEIIVTNQTNILREIEDEKAIVGSHEIEVKIYVYQDYYFEFEDGRNESFRINLISGAGSENLEKYIDFETKMPKMNFSRVNSEFIESNETYLIRFEMWK